MTQPSNTYSGKDASVSIVMEKSGDVRFYFNSTNTDTDSISFEFPISGNKSKNTLNALYAIIEGTISDSEEGIKHYPNSASRVPEIDKVLDVTINGTLITLSGSDSTRVLKKIEVVFSATRIQLGQFQRLILAIIEDNTIFCIGQD